MIEVLRKRQGAGTQLDLAREIGVSAAFMSDIFRGKRAPSGRILEFLGYQRIVRYEPKKNGRK